jgi:flagellar protein FliS
MFSNPIATYQQIGIESDVKGADPHRLIVLLFDGAESALSKAQVQIQEKDLEGKSHSLNKAIEIILDGLSSSLDVEQGGELAHNLRALYGYMATRLIHANIHMDTSAVSEVQKLLGELSDAWKQIGPTNSAK